MPISQRREPVHGMSQQLAMGILFVMAGRAREVPDAFGRTLCGLRPRPLQSFELTTDARQVTCPRCRAIALGWRVDP